MNYSETLSQGFINCNLSLNDVVRRLQEIGIKVDRSYLSKLRTGKKPPASDHINIALAQILNIDETTLLNLACMEKIPQKVLQLIKSDFSQSYNEIHPFKYDMFHSLQPGDKVTLTLEVTVSQIQHNVRGTEIVLVDEDQRQYILPDGDKRITFKALKETGIKESGD